MCYFTEPDQELGLIMSAFSSQPQETNSTPNNTVFSNHNALQLHHALSDVLDAFSRLLRVHN